MTTTTSTDVAVIGAGIAGLANALAAAKLGHPVTVFERSGRAMGASIRNFGMVWPIGQPGGPWHDVSLRSRATWLDTAERAGCWIDPCGSIFLAHREDELRVLTEFAERAPALGFPCELLDREQALARSPAAHRDHVIGGLFSPTEACVNPRDAIARIAGWLAEAHGVTFHFHTPIAHIDMPIVTAADGRRWRAGRIVVCSGDDFATLFPEVFAGAGIRRCKIQMMRTVAQPAGWRIGPMIASGLTLRHYPSFDLCESLAALKQRIAAESPQLDQFGIHVMASQHQDGGVVLGDSHEYGDDITPFDKAHINEMILRELRQLIQLKDWSIAEHWHGTYAKHPSLPRFLAEPQPGARVFWATGGTGMTMSFGMAEQMWEQWEDGAGVGGGAGVPPAGKQIAKR